MKSTFKSFLLLSLTALLIHSCKKESTFVTPDLGYSYFPNNVGHYIIYDVDSIYKDGFSSLVTVGKYQIKEVIESIFIDNQGRPTMRIERYRKDTINYPEWTIYNVWTANLNTTNAERFENNIRYIKLVFPVKVGTTWKGNAMNTDEEEDYEYTTAHEPMTINNLSFDSVTTVQQADELFNIAQPKFKQEKYAAGIGLVYRKKYVIETKTNPQTGVIDTSSYVDYTEQIAGYGN